MYFAADPVCTNCTGLESGLVVRASSELEESGRTYSAAQIADGDDETAWCEGVDGHGRGSSLTFSWDASHDLKVIWLYPGYMKSADHFFNNGRPKTLRISSGEQSLDVALPDVARDDFQMAKNLGTVVPLDWRGVQELTVVVVDVYEGEKYADLCWSEVDILVAGE